MTWATPAADGRWERIVDAIAKVLVREAAVEGVFLSGSLVAGRDWFSDIDLGVASRNSAAAFRKAWSLRGPIGQAVGPPVRVLERGWGHCRMVALLYGKSLFPPIGLQVDVVFSQIKHVGEQMPYTPHRVVLDRRGRLRRALGTLRRRKPPDEMRQELEQRMHWFAFFVHDALKAYGRRDLFNFQSLVEGMRQAVFHAVGARAGRSIYGGKWAFRAMTASERSVVEASYREFTPQMVRRLARTYRASLAPVAARFGVGDELIALEEALAEIL